ncbi:MAG: LacI family transcriptional regulator, partial [Delftia sp.]|nr:LacI family transcriptional regulator [Delftia sp.]
MDKQIDKATRKRGRRMALVTLAAPIAAAAAVAMGAALPRAALAQQPWP